MKNKTIQLYTSPRFDLAQRTGPTMKAVRLAPLALMSWYGLAMAQAAGDGAAAKAGVEQLASDAKTGMTGVVGVIITLLILGIGIRALWFGNKQVKTGISAAK
jgi:hypothetical protein